MLLCGDAIEYFKQLHPHQHERNKESAFGIA
jgi:hypothetical protein